MREIGGVWWWKGGGGKRRKREIWVDECLMRPNGLLCDTAAEDQVGF